MQGDWLVLGTRAGRVLGLDGSDGSWAKPLRMLRQHAGPVLDVALDSTGSFVASSSSHSTGCTLAVDVVPGNPGRSEPDGSSEECQTGSRSRLSGSLSFAWSCSFVRPVLSISLCPHYASGQAGSRVVCTGGEDGCLVLSRQGALETRHASVHSGEGPITAVRWRGTLIAWANSKGVKVVDVQTYQKVTQIQWPGSARDVSSPCCLTWFADDVLVIGWGEEVIMAEIRQKTGGPAGILFASIVRHFRLADSIVRGMTEYDEQHLSLVLEARNAAVSAVYSVCSWSGHVVCSTALPVTPGTGCGGFSLVSRADGSLGCVVAGGGLVMVEPRSVGDHVASLVRRGRFESAVELASAYGGLSADNLRSLIVSQTVAPLLQRREGSRAAAILRQLGTEDADTWRECVHLFDSSGQLRLLVPEIPVPPEAAALPCEIYDAVLGRLAALSPGALRSALDLWPASLGVYSTAPLMASLRQALPAGLQDEDTQGCQGSWGSRGVEGLCEEQRLLAEALAALHEARAELVAAAQLLARVGSSLLFSFLARHLGPPRQAEATSLCRLRSALSAPGGFVRLFELSPAEALSLAAQHNSTFKTSLILDVLAPVGRQWEHHYLRLLLHHAPVVARPFSMRLAVLAAELEPHTLRPLLERLQLPVGKTASKTALAAEKEEAEGTDGEASAGYTALRRTPPVDSNSRDLVASGDDSPQIDMLELLELSRSCGALDAVALLLQSLGRPQEALRVLLELGDVRGVLRLGCESSASASAAPELWQELLAAAMRDAYTCSVLLDCITDGSAVETLGAVPSVGELFRQLPPGLAVPRVPARAAVALHDADADRDLYLTSLRQMQHQTATLSQKVYRTQRRGRAMKAAAGPATARRIASRDHLSWPGASAALLLSSSTGLFASRQAEDDKS
ncbi:unnamed protein product [Polarella glacialis]|uniref:Vps41 beta-propeller domain-containing protein n=1 Tax=Polarella glacialis TaxID=89957 RepID=A0A813D954_POLGL|nr:unnamed protein product [Polarella glacialis]